VRLSDDRPAGHHCPRPQDDAPPPASTSTSLQ
jgi:hypothetical protein